MKKKVAVVTVAEAEEAAMLAELPLEATVALAEVADAIRDGLLAFASATGLVVMHQMMEAELTGRVGAKHARIPAGERTGNWHGSTKGSVVLGGRQVTAARPRGRTMAGTEIELTTWKVFSSNDLLTSLVVERMLAGVATRRHADVAEPVGRDLEARGPTPTLQRGQRGPGDHPAPRTTGRRRLRLHVDAGLAIGTVLAVEEHDAR